MKKICPHCHIEFETLSIQKVYCSRRCMSREAEKRHLHKVGYSVRRKWRNNKYHHDRITDRLELLYHHKLLWGCSRCPERRPSCLQFHHLDRTTKLDEISKLARRGTTKQLIAEITKCVLLCANCHAVEENGDGFKNDIHRQVINRM